MRLDFATGVVVVIPSLNLARTTTIESLATHWKILPETLILHLENSELYRADNNGHDAMVFLLKPTWYQGLTSKKLPSRYREYRS